MLLVSLIFIQDLLNLSDSFKDNRIRHQLPRNAKLRKQHLESSDVF